MDVRLDNLCAELATATEKLTPIDVLLEALMKLLRMHITRLSSFNTEV